MYIHVVQNKKCAREKNSKSYIHQHTSHYCLLFISAVVVVVLFTLFFHSSRFSPRGGFEHLNRVRIVYRL